MGAARGTTATGAFRPTVRSPTLDTRVRAGAVGVDPLTDAVIPNIVGEPIFQNHGAAGVLDLYVRQAVPVVPGELPSLAVGDSGLGQDVAFIVKGVIVRAIAGQPVARRGRIAGRVTIAVEIVSVREKKGRESFFNTARR